MFNLQLSERSVNTSTGCAPAPLAQALGPQGLQVGVRVLMAGRGWGVDQQPELSLQPHVSGSPPQPPAHPALLHTTSSTRDPGGLLPVWGPPVQLPGVCRHPCPPQEQVRSGPAWVGVVGPPDKQLCGLQVPTEHARASPYTPWLPAARCTPDRQQPLPAAGPEPWTRHRSDPRPRAPAPSAEPPACPGWPVAQGECQDRGELLAGSLGMTG